jgi:hypothetical protein
MSCPPGTWDVTAEAVFDDRGNCTATPSDLTTTLRVEVSR